jgi:hypothetical protein
MSARVAEAPPDGSTVAVGWSPDDEIPLDAS